MDILNRAKDYVHIICSYPTPTGLLHSENGRARKRLSRVLPLRRAMTATSDRELRLHHHPMTENGPDMDIIENLIKDPSQGHVERAEVLEPRRGVIYSEGNCAVLRRSSPPRPDFMLMWDNAYCIHEFDGISSLRSSACAPKTETATWSMSFASTKQGDLPRRGHCVAVMAASQHGASLHEAHRHPDHRL